MKFEVEIKGDALAALKGNVDSNNFLSAVLRKIVIDGLCKMHRHQTHRPLKDMPNIHEINVTQEQKDNE